MYLRKGKSCRQHALGIMHFEGKKTRCGVDIVRKNLRQANSMLSFLYLDGCPEEDATGYSWPETDLALVAMVSCICGDINTAEINRIAIRECGGSFVEGAVWMEPDITECQFSSASLQLCDASIVSFESDIYLTF